MTSIESERPFNIGERLKKDIESLSYIQRILGSLGLYDASQDSYVNPPNPVVTWQVDYDDGTTIQRGEE
jgi:hypothetical protein